MQMRQVGDKALLFPHNERGLVDLSTIMLLDTATGVLTRSVSRSLTPGPPVPHPGPLCRPTCC